MCRLGSRDSSEVENKLSENGRKGVECLNLVEVVPLVVSLSCSIKENKTTVKRVVIDVKSDLEG
jgi:hypothetical protein